MSFFNQPKHKSVIFPIAIATLIACVPSLASAQRMRFPNQLVTPPATNPGLAAPQVGAPLGGGAVPAFDPYSGLTSGGIPAGQFPATTGPIVGSPVPNGTGLGQPPAFLQPPAGTPFAPAPNFGSGPAPANFGSPSGFGGGNLFSRQSPQTGPSTQSAWPNQVWARLRNDWAPRLLEHPRFRHTYIHGDDGDDLQINESEVATTLTFPNFLWTTQPIRISPGFVAHFWDGPDTGVTGADLPSKAYSSYFAFDFASAWDRTAGVELNLTLGVYTDFDHTTSDSIRLTGLGLGWVRLNNYATVKMGIEYLDRLDVKLLPAIGVFLMPTNDLKVDVYFPRPKIAHRIPNYRNLEMWVYLGGEYGGGSWTIRRMGGMGDQVDINDIRIFSGIEWLGLRGVTGFAEIGYVFDREILYASDPLTKFRLSDAFMVRAGISF